MLVKASGVMIPYLFLRLYIISSIHYRVWWLSTKQCWRVQPAWCTAHCVWFSCVE